MDELKCLGVTPCGESVQISCGAIVKLPKAKDGGALVKQLHVLKLGRVRVRFHPPKDVIGITNEGLEDEKTRDRIFFWSNGRVGRWLKGLFEPEQQLGV